MQKNKPLSSIFIFLVTFAFAQAAQKPKAQAMTSSKDSAVATKGNVSPEEQKKYLETAGWNLGKQSIEAAVAQFGLTDSERKIVIQGIKKGAEGAESPIDLREKGEDMLQYLQTKADAQQKKHQEEIAKHAEDNKKKSMTYFSKLDKDPKVKKTASGLYYEVIETGSAKPDENSTVKIDYVGTLIDGKEFDSSKARGEPAVFNLQHVIPGFREGLQLVGKGGKIRLYIPSDLAYGNAELPGIPAGSTLIFDVDMLDVLPKEEASTPHSS